MRKTQYIILTVSIVFFATCLVVTSIKTKVKVPERTSVVSSRELIMKSRLDAVEKAKETGETGYSYESMVAPPLM